MSIKQIDIYSRARLKREIAKSKGRLLTDPTVRIITIHDSRGRPLIPDRYRDRHLFLAFDDVTPGLVARSYPGTVLADPTDGKLIVEFMQRITQEGATRLIVNCEAGISRSSAVATALAEIFGVEKVHAHQGQIHPNSHVRRVIFHQARHMGLYDFPSGNTPAKFYDHLDFHNRANVTVSDKYHEGIEFDF